MTVKTAKAIIANLPDEMELFMEPSTGGFRYVPVESASVKPIPFLEDPSDEITDETPVIDCLVFEEE